jgi:hypothetical protein
MSDDQEVQKILRNALAGMPATIESGFSSPRTNAIDRLRWVGLAIKVFHGPDVENKGKAARILKATVPALEKIRDEHQSERLRNAAAKYLEADRARSGLTGPWRINRSCDQAALASHAAAGITRHLKAGKSRTHQRPS